MLSSQRKVFHTFFAKFRIVFVFYFFILIREKVCEMQTKNFSFFSRNVSFAWNPSCEYTHTILHNYTYNEVQKGREEDEVLQSEEM